MSDKFLESCGILQNHISDSVGFYRHGCTFQPLQGARPNYLQWILKILVLLSMFRFMWSWVIGVVRQKYSISKGTLPIEFVSKKTDQDCPHIDKILRTCCALCNM